MEVLYSLTRSEVLYVPNLEAPRWASRTSSSIWHSSAVHIVWGARTDTFTFTFTFNCHLGKTHNRHK